MQGCSAVHLWHAGWQGVLLQEGTPQPVKPGVEGSLVAVRVLVVTQAQRHQGLCAQGCQALVQLLGGNIVVDIPCSMQWPECFWT